MLEVKLPPGEHQSDATKKVYLAIQLGVEGRRIFGKNPVMERRADVGNFYMELKEAAKNQFSPQVSITKARYDFTRRMQEGDEPLDEFLTAIKTLAANCDFRADMERSLMVQLMNGCVAKRTQRELLAMADPTLARVIAIMRAKETARNESDHMNPKTDPVHTVESGR